MARIVSTVLVAALLAATAAAFALTEGLKLQPSPIRQTQLVSKVFSPVCDCDTSDASIRFRLRRADRLDVSIVDGGGAIVRALVRGQSLPAGRVAFDWDGYDNAGTVVPEGEYKFRVHLRRERKTIDLPNPISVDVTAPAIRSFVLSRDVLSPDGDRRADRVIVRYRFTEKARALLYANGRRAALTNFARDEDKLDWFGKVGGRPLPAGRYRLQLGARDPAGNVAPRTAPKPVVIRYVALGRNRIEVAAGARFAVRVSSDARRIRWRLGSRGGIARPGTLVLRAPLQRGRFTLTVTARGHSTRAAVLVGAAAPR